MFSPISLFINLFSVPMVWDKREFVGCSAFDAPLVLSILRIMWIWLGIMTYLSTDIPLILLVERMYFSVIVYAVVSLLCGMSRAPFPTIMWDRTGNLISLTQTVTKYQPDEL